MLFTEMGRQSEQLHWSIANLRCLLDIPGDAEQTVGCRDLSRRGGVTGIKARYFTFE